MTLSLATGAKLDAATFTDFVARLRHDCVGPGTRDHCTADAIFIVQCRRLVYGLDTEYAPDNRVAICDDWEWFSPQDYYDDLGAEGRAALNRECQEWCQKQFMKADADDQWYVIGERDNHTVTGWTDRWEYVSAHFTNEAAEAFIKRKKHDYRKGIRVYVESQYYSWEFNAIKEALLSGRLQYVEQEPAQ